MTTDHVPKFANSIESHAINFNLICNQFRELIWKLADVDSGAVATLTGGANAEDTDPTLNIDFDAGEKLRLRADQSAGTGDMQDTTVALLIKWRS